MFKLNNIIKKIKPGNPSDLDGSSKEYKQDVKSVKNWFEERYDTITTQRNILLLLVILLLVLSIVSVAVVAYVIDSKKFDPFVIQIDNSTGIAQKVNPASSEILSGNESLAKYFIKKYVTARETYNSVDFETQARNIIRLFSSNKVYWDYVGYIKNDDNNPILKYGQKNTTYLTLKSWSQLKENSYIMRFSITETAQNRKVFNKIAVINFQYVPMELKESDIDVNPVGFQITDYRVDNDDS